MTDARKALDATLDQLEPDAVATIAYLADRLLMGQRYYGKIDLATDPRDWVKERREELGDLLVYTAFGELKKSLVKIEHDDVAREPASLKCSWASCQKLATQGKFCEAHAKQEPVTVRASAVQVESARLRGAISFACECRPRELRSDKGLRCANCNTLVRIV